MSADEGKAFARRIYELLGARNIEGLRALADPGFVNHTVPRGQASGIASMLEGVQGRFHAFPDVGYRIEEQIAESDKIVTRYTWWGTHRAALMDIAPTGRRVHVSGIEIHQVKEGRVAGVWRIEDDLSLMQQLDVVPTIPIGAAANARLPN